MKCLRSCTRLITVVATIAALVPVVVLAGEGTLWKDISTDPPDMGVPGGGLPTIDPDWSVARVWDETLLDAIRIDRPKPPTHARNLFHLSIAMWDAWATYDSNAIGYLTTEKNVAEDVQAAREEAISHAAFRLLMHRFPGTGFNPVDGNPCQPGAAVAQADFLAKMEALGYDPSFTSTEGDSPAAVGNRIGQAVIDFGLTDGSNEGFDLCFPDDTGYYSVNPELIFVRPGTTMIDPNHWQQLAFDYLVLQNGIVIGTALQTFVGVGWADVASFNIPPAPAGGYPPPTDCSTGVGALSPIFNPGCPPQLGGVGDEQLKAAMAELIRFQSWNDPTDGVLVDYSPGVHGNNSLGADDGTGHPINPFTCEPYAPHVLHRGDWTRVIAEFWADGPHSETPPGHWNTLANYLTDHPLLGEKRLGGAGGPLLDDLEWDVKLYLALNGAVHDAAIAAWGTKHYYDSSRPISLIRYMGGLGQSSEPGGMSYDPDGLPLEPGLIEVITEETIQPGQRHEHLKAFCSGGGLNEGGPCETDADCPDDGPFDGFCDSSVGKIAIRAWNGSPDDTENELGGVSWRRAIDWITYQASFFVTPPFPGYTSGHSTFSRAGAEVLTAFTGSEYFPGGLGTFVAEQNEFLDFEEGPSETVELQWATFRDAADEAGISRRFGGIHPNYDDYPGRIQGAEIGQAAWERALTFYNQTPGTPYVDPGNCNPKTTLCHKHHVTIEVSDNAVPAHLAHGDTIGPCSEDGDEAAESPVDETNDPGGLSHMDASDDDASGPGSGDGSSSRGASRVTSRGGAVHHPRR